MTVPIANRTIPVTITYKRMKRVILRYHHGQFFASVPRGTSPKWLKAQLIHHGPRLLKKIDAIPPAFSASGMYLFGEWHTLDQLRHQDPKSFASVNTLTEHDRERLKPQFTKLLQERVLIHQHRLGIHTPYRVRVREMRTRLGSNAKQTRRLSFAMKLIHFSWSIIDAVIVHELIHDRHFDHSPLFYQALEKAYPAYRQEHAKIALGHYQ